MGLRVAVESMVLGTAEATRREIGRCDEAERALTARLESVQADTERGVLDLADPVSDVERLAESVGRAHALVRTIESALRALRAKRLELLADLGREEARQLRARAVDLSREAESISVQAQALYAQLREIEELHGLDQHYHDLFLFGSRRSARLLTEAFRINEKANTIEADPVRSRGEVDVDAATLPGLIDAALGSLSDRPSIDQVEKWWLAAERRLSQSAGKQAGALGPIRARLVWADGEIDLELSSLTACHPRPYASADVFDVVTGRAKPHELAA